MALISGTISNLFSGVSQQAPALRLPTQAEEMDNFYPSLVDGLVKRPPVYDLSKIATDSAKKPGKIHIINRDPQHRYIVVFHNSKLAVYSSTGGLLFESTPAYLNGADPQQVGFLTVADHTFVINKTKTVGTRYVMEGMGPLGALVSVKQASYDTEYIVTVRISGAIAGMATYRTPKNYAVDEPPPTISTTVIASQLWLKLQDYPGFSSKFSIEGTGSAFFIRPHSGNGDFSCTISDSRGDTHINVARNTVQKFANLPAVAVRDFTVEVLGDENSAFDNYYVKFVPDDSQTTFGPGSWAETKKPALQHKFIDPNTMPHALVHTDGTFTLKAPEWANREVGDDHSAPDPLFIGSKIADMFLYRNRLGILSDDNLTLSAASDFFRFYPETVTTIVDSDPISLSAGHETVTTLKHGIPFQENLVVFSENAQFNMPTTDTLSPSTAALKISTTFEADLTVKPVSTGQTVAFCVRNGDCTGLREFYMDSDTLTRMTGNLTAHVPTYVPGNPSAMACSTTEDVLVVVSKKEQHRMYVYKYYWSGNEKLQAAWFTFTLPKSVKILDLTFLESRLYLLLNRNGDVYLSSQNFSIEHLTDTDDLAKTTLFIDRQADIMPGAYRAEENRTVWGPVPALAADERACVVNLRTLKQVECTFDPATYTVSAPGNHSGELFLFGTPYDSKYTFSEQFLRADDGSGNRIATQLGRLQFRRWALIYGPSCFFKVRTEQNGTVYEYPFTGEFVNRPLAFLAKPALFKGKFSFPVKSISDRVKVTITNDTCLPCSIISAEWEAFYTQRQRGRV